MYGLHRQQLQNPYPVLKKLLEFVFGVEDITGTRVHEYLKLAVKEEAPQIYAPRKGQINKNADKYTPELLGGMQRNCAGILKKLDYMDYFPK